MKKILGDRLKLLNVVSLKKRGQNMASVKYPIIAFFIFLIFFSCSSDPIESGDQAFQNQNYKKAIQYYLDAFKQGIDNPELREKIALSYFKFGEILYKSRGVISAFEARVEKAREYLPENFSESIKEELSDVHLSLATAYINTEPENFIQKRKFFENALLNLEKAVTYNPQNSKATEALAKFREQHFEKLYAKGLNFYQSGSKNKSDYLVAEYYLKKAMETKPDKSEVRKYLMQARQKTLSLLDYDQQLPFAITDQMQKSNVYSYFIVLQNNTAADQKVDATHFVLIGEDDSEFSGFREKRFSNAFLSKTLPSGAEIDGVVSFKVPQKVPFVRIEYRHDGQVLGYKNLPY